jgi:predicted nucleotidyltransferase
MSFGLSAEVTEKIRSVLSHHQEVQSAILYGSRAKGNYKRGSDIDLTLVGEKLNLSKLAKICNELDDLSLPYTFDFSIYDQIKNIELLDHIKRVGKIFYSGER